MSDNYWKKELERMHEENAELHRQLFPVIPLSAILILGCILAIAIIVTS